MWTGLLAGGGRLQWRFDPWEQPAEADAVAGSFFFGMGWSPSRYIQFGPELALLAHLSDTQDSFILSPFGFRFAVFLEPNEGLGAASTVRLGISTDGDQPNLAGSYAFELGYTWLDATRLRPTGVAIGYQASADSGGAIFDDYPEPVTAQVGFVTVRHAFPLP